MKALAHISVAALLLALAGCGGGTPRQGDPVEDIEVLTLDGDEKRTNDLIDGKVAVLKFGATWCVWCDRQLRELDKVIDEYGDEVVVLDIYLKEPADKVRAHHERHKFKATPLLDPTAKAARAYGFDAIPLTIIADKTGRILFDGGYTKFAALKAVLDRALYRTRD